MSSLSKSSSLKRKPAESKQTGKPKTLFEVGNPEWPCLDVTDCAEGRLTICKRGPDDKEYVTYFEDVGGTPSIGNPTDEKDARGCAVWENYYGVFKHCAGAKSVDGRTFKNASHTG